MVNAPSTQPKPGLFPIPAFAVARHPDVILSARELKRSIDSLPLGNPVKASGQLLHQLRLLTRDPNPGTRFSTLLELYSEPTLQLLEIVRERLPGSPDSALPLDQLESLVVDLLTELAYGHLRIANQLLSAGKSPALENLYQAMSLLDAALEIERQHYRRLVPERWQLLLKIYLHAEFQQFGAQPMDAKQRQEGQPDTIQGLFYRALIVSLCDPNNQVPSEVLAWQRWTTEHAGLLSFTLLPQGAFAIPVDFSGELGPLTGARSAKPGTETRYLATDRFVQELEDDPEQAPAGLRQALISLVKGRRTPEQRRSERHPRNHPYQLIYGLHNIHRRLEELSQGEAPARSAVRPLPGRQVNHSRFGAAFHIQGPINPPLSIGEPVLAEAKARPGGGVPVGFAARIRRVFSDDGQHIEIGVEKIQGRLIPVTIVGTAAERARGDKLGLLQHEVETGNYVLLASRSIYREGDSVVAEGPSMRYSLRMRRLGGVVQHTAYIDVEVVDF